MAWQRRAYGALQGLGLARRVLAGGFAALCAIARRCLALCPALDVELLRRPKSLARFQRALLRRTLRRDRAGNDAPLRAPAAFGFSKTILVLQTVVLQKTIYEIQCAASIGCMQVRVREGIALPPRLQRRALHERRHVFALAKKSGN